MTGPCKRRKVKNPSRKVSRHVRKSVVKKSIVHDETVGRFWDKQKTIEQNFATVGLASKVNDDLGKSEVRKRLDQWQADRMQKLVEIGAENMKQEEEVGEQAIFLRPMLNEEEIFSRLEDLFSKQQDYNGDQVKKMVVEELEQRSKDVQPKIPEPLSEFERSYIEKLVKKYGDDYKKMVLDHLLNARQLTAGQLRQMAAKL